MAINKVVFGDNTLIDLTGDTVTAETLGNGVTAHTKSGELVIGTASISEVISVQGKTGAVVLSPEDIHAASVYGNFGLAGLDLGAVTSAEMIEAMPQNSVLFTRQTTSGDYLTDTPVNPISLCLIRTLASTTNWGFGANPDGRLFFYKYHSDVATANGWHELLVSQPWINATLASGVTTTSTVRGNGILRYKKELNRVSIAGGVRASVASGGITLTTLPSGYRPTYGAVHKVTAADPTSGNNGTRVARLSVDTSGVMKCDWVMDFNNKAYTSDVWIDCNFEFFID